MQNNVISSEDIAWEYLKNHDASSNSYVTITGWDTWSLRIIGNDYNGTIDYSLLKTLLELQTSIHKLYAYLHYNSPDARRLTQEDKNKLRLKISVNSGSTNIEMILGDIIKQMVSAMTPTQTFFTFIFGITLFFGHKFFKAWTNYKIKNKEADKYTAQEFVLKDVMHAYSDIIIKLSDNDNIKIQTIAQIAQERDFNVLKNLKNTNADNIEYQNEKFDTEQIKSILKADKVIIEQKNIRLDGLYKILNVNYDKEDYIEFKLNAIDVPNLKSEKTIVAFYPRNVIDSRDTVSFKLQEDRSFNIQINAKMLNAVIEEATIIDIKEHVS